METALGQKIIELRARVAADFDAGNWEELGLLTGQSDLNQPAPPASPQPLLGRRGLRQQRPHGTTADHRV